MDDHRWSYQDLGHLLHTEWGVLVSSLVWLQMMGARRWNYVPKSSWGILGQLDTRSLSQGIPDLDGPKTWCHWSLQMQLQCCVLTVLIILTVHLFVVMAIVCLLLMSRLRLMLVLKLYLFDSESSLVDWWSERECFMHCNDPFDGLSGSYICVRNCKIIGVIWSIFASLLLCIYYSQYSILKSW